MRQRNKPWADQLIAENPQWMIPNPADFKGKWQELFGNRNPIHIEIGTGKGKFISEMAKRNPDINYIGIELSKKVIVSALEKCLVDDIINLKLLHINAEDMMDYFADGEVALIYLNFSDPWPKTRHEKRRLTHHRFLKNYQMILPKNGEIHFKTDNRGLFEYSLVSFNQFGLKLNAVSFNLHEDDCSDNVMTEYEAKFSAKGYPIYRAEVQFQEIMNGVHENEN